MSIMPPLHLLCLLLCMAPSSSLEASQTPEDHNTIGGRTPPLLKQILPVVLDRYTETLVPPAFRGHVGPRADPRHGPATLCGIECQRALPPLDRAEQERILGYETVHENGTRTRTRVSLRGFADGPPQRPAPMPQRRKRQVFGPDGRFVIADSHFATSYPFAAAARLSTGCSGVLVSPRHVLTAAHCVHDGTDYLEGVPGLRVGLLQLKTKRGRGGGGGGGRRRGKGGETPSEEEEEEEHNSVDPVEPVTADRPRGGRGRHSRRRGRRERGEADETKVKEGVSGEGGGRGRRRQRRTAPVKRPAFRWSRVKRTHVPAGWIQTDALNNENPQINQSLSADYDYALLELKRPVKQRPMALGVAPNDKPLARIHFSGYDLEGAPSDGGEKVVYRFCTVAQESDDLIYQHCDAQQGATGAGVYIRARQEVDVDDGGKGRWRRKVIGVFSGHRWVEMEGSGQRDFNVAVRITPAKYAQICHWIHGDPSRCEAL